MNDKTAYLDFGQLLRLYEDHLRQDIIPFWLNHGIDHECGGLFNFLADDGSLLSEDKVVWSQGRGLWTLSALYNYFDRSPVWLELARKTARFLLDHGRDDSGRWSFRLSREGRLIEGPQSAYVDAFAIYGLTEYARASGDEEALQAAIDGFRRTSVVLQDHSTLATRPHLIPPGVQSHGPSMIFALVYHELGLLSGDSEIVDRALELAETIMSEHLKPERQLLYEFVRPGGELADGDVGQTFLPGHVVESMWFMERIYGYHGRLDRIRLALDAIRWHLEKGWDQEYGGIFLACHAGGGIPVWHAPDSKVWWPATESLFALLRAYEVSGESWCVEWYRKVHDYAFSHYPDSEHGEWIQNLDRAGRPISGVVPGLVVKDPFHLPRCLIYSIGVLKRLAMQTAANDVVPPPGSMESPRA